MIICVSPSERGPITSVGMWIECGGDDKHFLIWDSWVDVLLGASSSYLVDASVWHIVLECWCNSSSPRCDLVMSKEVLKLLVIR